MKKTLSIFNYPLSIEKAWTLFAWGYCSISGYKKSLYG